MPDRKPAPRAWLVTLGLSVLAVTAAALVRTASPPAPEISEAQSDPCFRYGRLECCLRPDE